MIQAKDVSEATGLSYRQIQYWDGKLLEVPRRSGKNDKARYRSFSLENVVVYAVAASLRQNGISLQKIRKIFLKQIADLLKGPLSSSHKIGMINDILVAYDGEIRPQIFTKILDYGQLLSKLNMVVVTQ